MPWRLILERQLNLLLLQKSRELFHELTQCYLLALLHDVLLCLLQLTVGADRFGALNVSVHWPLLRGRIRPIGIEVASSVKSL
jgi:hypothetical protein